MKTSNFRDWTLDTLDDTFGLKQIWECQLMEQWESSAKDIEISDIDRQVISKFQKPLIRGGKSWNEVELENKFISPLIIQAEIDDEEIGYFLERPFKAVVGEYELSGIVDGMIATGFRNPKIPYFCMHEYKKSVENAGMPDAQALVAMLVAREVNENKKPIYGMYVVGLIWNFMVLNGTEYCISRNYDSSTESVFELFKMLKALKQIIKTELI